MEIQTEDIYRCLVQNSADGLVVTDLKGDITSCNPAFAHLVSRSEGDIVGHPLKSFVDWENGGSENGDTADGAAAGALSPPKSVPATRPATIVSQSGMNVVMPVAHFPISLNGKKPKAFITIVYIVQAHSVQQAQTEFVSTVSHELRTPLTSIKGFADTILRAGDRLDSSQQRRYVGIIKDQADRLTRLVEDLLAVSRLESKKLQLTIRAIDLNEAVQRVHRNLAEKAADHRIAINIPPGLPQVWADADRLEQILTNLVDNAIKYSPAGTTVTITAKDVRGEPDMVEFSVTDQGAGIPKEHQSQIFIKFSRLDNPLVRQTEGTGLGLYITRSLVLALGGHISIDSAPGRTTFTVQIPAATQPPGMAR